MTQAEKTITLPTFSYTEGLWYFYSDETQTIIQQDLPWKLNVCNMNPYDLYIKFYKDYNDIKFCKVVTKDNTKVITFSVNDILYDLINDVETKTIFKPETD